MSPATTYFTQPLTSWVIWVQAGDRDPNVQFLIMRLILHETCHEKKDRQVYATIMGPYKPACVMCCLIHRHLVSYFPFHTVVL